MKILFILSLFSLMACSDTPNPKGTDKPRLSTTQTEVQTIVDSFKIEYVAARSSSLKDSIVNKYNAKFFNYLSNNSLDSIKVHVDTVIIKDSTVTTKFHCDDDIAFQYSLAFTKPMTKYHDSLFQFMAGLKIGSDTTINFSYMGSHQLSEPRNNSSPTLKIFAVPSFLKRNN